MDTSRVHWFDLMESIPIAGQAKVFAGGFGKANFGISDSITLENIYL
jgi:hypothetical protein